MTKQFYFKLFSLVCHLFALSLNVQVQFKCQIFLFDSLIELYQVLPLRNRLDLGAMAMKVYFPFPKPPVLLEPHHQIILCYIRTIVGELLLHCRDAVGVFYNPNRLGYRTLPKECPVAHRLHLCRGVTLKRCSRCILTAPPPTTWAIQVVSIIKYFYLTYRRYFKRHYHLRSVGTWK